ncbi:AI-2E family transporter [Verrucomicrobiota bacterium]
MESNRVVVGLLTILCVIAVGVICDAAQAVLVPLIIAWLLSYILAPVVNFLVDHKVPVGPATLVVLLLLLGICYLSGLFIHERITGFAEEFPKYQGQLQTMSNDIYLKVNQRFNLPEEAQFDVNWTKWVYARLVTISGSFARFLGNLGLVLIFLIFMLLGKPYFGCKVQAAFPVGRSRKITSVISSIARQIGRYLTIKLCVSLVTGFLVWLSCILIGIDFPVTWGTLAFFLNFIPTVGSVIASIPPVILALVQFYPSYWQAGVAAVCMLSIQQVMGSFIEPKVQGDNLNLSPLVILMALVFMGWLWGAVGALLSVPLAVALKIVCENIDALQPISIMMGSGKACIKDS